MITTSPKADEGFPARCRSDGAEIVGARAQARQDGGRRRVAWSRLSSRPRIEDLVEQVGEQVQGDEDHADQQHAGHHRVHVAGQHVVGHVLAEPRPGEHRLDQHRAFEQPAVGQRHDRHELHPDVGEGVPPDRPPERQPLHPRRGDILLVQLVEHEAPRHPGDVGERGEPEDRGRQDQVVDRVPEDVPVPGERGVDQQEPGHRIDHPVVEVADPPAAADPAEPGVEDDQPDHAGPEDRHRMPEQRHHPHDVVGRPVLPHRRPDPERDAEAGPEQDREGRELDRRRHHRRDVLGHRLPGPERRPEVAAQRVAEIARELHVDRLVHPQLLVDLLVGRRVGLLADDRPHRIDRHQPPDREGEDEKPDQRDEDRPGLSGEGQSRPAGGQSHRIISRGVTGAPAKARAFGSSARLGDGAEVGAPGRVQHEPLEVGAVGDRVEHLGEGLDRRHHLLDLLLDVLVHRRLLRRVGLDQRRVDLGVQLRVEERGPPALEVGQLRLVAVVRVVDQRPQVRVRVRQLPAAAAADQQLEVPLAHRTVDLLARARDDLGLDAGLRQRRLDRGRGAHERRVGERPQRHLEAVRIAGLGQQRLRLLDVERVARIGQLAEEAGGDRPLMQLPVVGHDRLVDPLVVDQVAQRLADLRIGEPLVLHADREVVEARARLRDHLDALRPRSAP